MLSLRGAVSQILLYPDPSPKEQGEGYKGCDDDGADDDEGDGVKVQSLVKRVGGTGGDGGVCGFIPKSGDGGDGGDGVVGGECGDVVEGDGPPWEEVVLPGEEDGGEGGGDGQVHQGPRHLGDRVGEHHLI